LKFRPHFKTHQSKQIGRWFRDEGVDEITGSSVSMARYFNEDGWNDITIAFPLNLREADEITELSHKVSLNILVTMASPAEIFSRHLKVREQPTGVYIKIDTGYNRTGLLLSDIEEIERIINTCRQSSSLLFKGFLTHTGHPYNARGRNEVEMISREAFRLLGSLKVKFDSGPDPLALSVGDTPACSLLSSFDGIDEIIPGNFVFFDVMQTIIGSCEPGKIAISLA
jgi:D-serine deaminase-like pyridoxal phosphate-dependent protein